MTPREDSSSRRLADKVADRLQQRILEGTFQPSERLPAERELAEQLQVNRSSVREALKKLEQLRLVRIQQGSGIRVRRPEDASFDLVRHIMFREGRLDRDLLDDLLELREALLPAVLRLAVERSTLAERREAASRLRAAADPELSDTEFAATLRASQEDLARMTQNRVVQMLSNSLVQFIVDPVGRAVVESIARERKPLLPLLQRLAVAFEAGDAAPAERALRELLRRSREIILAAVDALAAEAPEVSGRDA